MTDATPRWHYRLDNFSRALTLLRQAVDESTARTLSLLEQEGLIQRFEYTWELAWKVLKDYLEAEGVTFATVTPATVIKAAIAARLVRDGDIWLRALDARNRVSHSYSQKAFERTVSEIRSGYLVALEAVHKTLIHNKSGSSRHV